MQPLMGKEREGTCHHNEMVRYDRRLEVMDQQNAKPLAICAGSFLPINLTYPLDFIPV